MMFPNKILFWAKTDIQTGQELYHNLIWHLIDTGMVACSLWDEALSKSFKKDIAQSLGLETNQARNLMAYWVSLHDIGKAGPGFQSKWEPGKQHIQNAGFNFPNCPQEYPGYHGLATTWILEAYWKDGNRQRRRFTNSLAQVIGGHHGSIPTDTELTNLSAYKFFHIGDDSWHTARQDIIESLKTVFDPPVLDIIPDQQAKINAILLLTAGFTTTADWIASDKNYFYYDDGHMPLTDYLTQSAREAMCAVHDLGWGGWKAEGIPMQFEELFPDYTPNPLQSAFIQATKNIQSPFLVILEAPTGSGKTESAFSLADAILQKEQKAGLYVAMPTQATSNQMFDRTTKFLAKRYPEDRLNIQLVHGSALINETFKKFRAQGINQDMPSSDGNVSAAEWFLPRKKSLLAPFGVGTIDQTFLSVMCSKFFFLRLFGLANKIIIFDEVHAYDVYMLEIFKRLLQWLRAINTSVILLSATLPEQSRIGLLRTFSPEFKDNQPTRADYPRLSISTDQEISTISLGEVTSRSIKLEWFSETEITIVLKDKLIDGGNAAIICNRVDQAIEIYRQLRNVFSAQEMTLFHSRFPYTQREEIEQKVKCLYGKDTKNRPKRSIVIATQVIEQSLDLDFDIMVSALAPIDLLIQRAGRLQRHEQSKTPPERPTSISEPHLMLLLPNTDKTLPSFGKDCYIYEPYLLQRTWYALKGQTVLNLPAQTDELIEQVYSDKQMDIIPPVVWEEMLGHLDKMLRKDEKDALAALNQLVSAPQRNILGRIQSQYDDEHDPRSLNAMHILTRNARPSVQLICLREDGNGLRTLDRNFPVNLDEKPDEQTMIACLRSAVSLSNWKLVNYFLKQPVPAGWKKSAALRTYIPLVLINNQFHDQDLLLKLDSEMGLIISTDESGKED